MTEVMKGADGADGVDGEDGQDGGSVEVNMADMMLIPVILQKMKAVGLQPEPTKERLPEIIGEMLEQMRQQQARIQELENACRASIKSLSAGL